MLLLICFYLLRLFGQGAIFLVSVTAINLWWVKMRGLMMGIAGAGASVGITALVPVLLQHGLATVGWRQTYVVMAVCAAFGMAPLGFAFYRESPETYGMLPDAGKHAGLAASDSAAQQQPENENENEAEDVDAKPSSSSSSPEDEPAWTRAEALRTAAFWSVSFGSLSVALTGTAFWFHLTAVIGERVGGTARTAGGDGFGSGDGGGSGSDHMSELGSGDGDVLAGCVSSAAPPPALMSSVYTVLAIASTFTRIAAGWLVDRVASRYVLSLSLLLQAVALFLVPLVRSTAAILVVCTIQGVSQAVFSSVGGVVYANFFGRKHLGAISGVGKSLVVLGSALGPFPFGVVHDLTGTFDLAFYGAALLSIGCMLMALRYGHAPQRKTTKVIRAAELGASSDHVAVMPDGEVEMDKVMTRSRSS